MKLSEFKDEEALEILEKILDPVSVIMTDMRFVSLVRTNKPKIIIAKEIVKDHKKEVVEILAAVNGETPETYHFTLISLLKDAVDLLDDPDLNEVFQWQGQTGGVKSSVSALENTEVGDQ